MSKKDESIKKDDSASKKRKHETDEAEVCLPSNCTTKTGIDQRLLSKVSPRVNTRMLINNLWFLRQATVDSQNGAKRRQSENGVRIPTS